jgi:hypothetical protein
MSLESLPHILNCTTPTKWHKSSHRKHEWSKAHCLRSFAAVCTKRFGPSPFTVWPQSGMPSSCVMLTSMLASLSPVNNARPTRSKGCAMSITEDNIWHRKSSVGQLHLSASRRRCIQQTKYPPHPYIWSLPIEALVACTTQGIPSLRNGSMVAMLKFCTKSAYLYQSVQTRYVRSSLRGRKRASPKSANLT